MAKFLVQASFAAEAVKGVTKEGGTARRENLDKTIRGVGGKVEAFYFAFGETDVYVIIDVPDAATAIAAPDASSSAPGSG